MWCFQDSFECESPWLLHARRRGQALSKLGLGMYQPQAVPETRIDVSACILPNVSFLLA